MKPDSSSIDKPRVAGQSESVPEPRRVWAVPASPLNGVKFELGVVLLLVPLVWLVSARLIPEPRVQLLVLGGFGVAAALWLVWRARRAMRRAFAAWPAGDTDGAQ